MIAVKKEILDYIIEEGLSPNLEIYKGHKKDNLKEYVTIKVIPKDEMKETKIRNEAIILKNITNEHIVTLKEFVETETEWFFIFEYCKGGNLKQYIQSNKITADIAQSILIQIVKGLNVLCDHNISHETLTLRNILIENTEDIKLFNYTIAQKARNPNFAESEEHVLVEEIIKSTDIGDIWSIGVIAYELICKQELNLNGDIYKIPKELKLSIQWLDFLNKCLQKETEYSLEKLKNHPLIIRESQKVFNIEEFIEANPAVKAMIIEDECNYLFSINIKYSFIPNLPENHNDKKEDDELELAESCGPSIKFEECVNNVKVERKNVLEDEETKELTSGICAKGSLTEIEGEYIQINKTPASKEYSTTQYENVNITETYFS